MGKSSLSLIDNPITPKEAGANLGVYGEIDYGDGSFYISVSSKYPLASDINTTLTVTWDSWWSEGGGGDYHNESSTVKKLLRKGENSWLYIVQITCDKGMGAPGSNPSWGVKKMSWQWKTNKSGNRRIIRTLNLLILIGKITNITVPNIVSNYTWNSYLITDSKVINIKVQRRHY